MGAGSLPHLYGSILGWFNFAEVYAAAVREAPDPAHLVEVGTWLGRSTAFLTVEIANSGKAIRPDVVDHFRGSPGEPPHLVHVHENVGRVGVGDGRSPGEPPHLVHVRACGGSVYEEFTGNMRRGGVLDRMTVVAVDSAEAARRYPDGSLDFVFIDAAHDYASARADVAAWLPEVLRGGAGATTTHRPGRGS